MTDAPPVDLAAEEALIGAVLLDGAVLDELDGQVAPEHFYRGSHRMVWDAAVAVRSAGRDVDAVTVADELDRRGQIGDVGGHTRLAAFAAIPPAASFAGSYAAIVRGNADKRALLAVLAEGAQACGNGAVAGDVAASITARLANLKTASDTGRDRAETGAAFVLDAPTAVPAVWGQDDRILWAEGEPLLLVGPAGVGKTTLAQQLALARIGLRADLLGLPVAPAADRVLYIAADRPAQAARSMRRMVSEADRDALAEHLVVWRGPLPFDLTAEPARLAAMARHHGAGTLVIDSLKDVAPGLEKPEIGAAVNIALQTLVADGIDTAGLHHQRKATGDNRRPRALSDVYGSVWLTAGAGSVVLVWGEAGDAVVDLDHLKQPAEEVGPLTLVHDHVTGTTTVRDHVDPLEVLRASSRGLTARGLAEITAGEAEPDRNAVEKARRRLERLSRSGHAHKRDGARGGAGGGEAAVYYATDDRRQELL